MKKPHVKALTQIAFLVFILFQVRQCEANTKNNAEIPIVVVIPSYNNKQWYQSNLGSVFNQKYENYRVIYIDDASPDGTGELVREYIKELGQEHRVTLIQNQERVGTLANLYAAISQCEPHEVVAQLDGDDWFYHYRVLQKLNEVYSDPEVWVTYGQFIYFPCGSDGWAAQVPESVIETNGFRDYSWVTTALRTFYAGLFHKIKKEDLLYEGTFFQMSSDLAYMWPVVEMAGYHSRFIPDVLYVYNFQTPTNDQKVDRSLQIRLGNCIRSREKYTPMENPY